MAKRCDLAKVRANEVTKEAHDQAHDLYISLALEFLEFVVPSKP